MDTAENKQDTLTRQISGAVLGLAVGDALGVPVEFESRGELAARPVTDMRGGGSHGQPPGTWSDDTSLTLCLLTELCGSSNSGDVNYESLMHRFASWTDHGYYTARGEVFDMGVATREAILRYERGVPPLRCGGAEERSNGNGSLMRVLPLLFWLQPRLSSVLSLCEPAMEIIHNVSALTHAHPRSQMACGIYLCVAETLAEQEKSPLAASIARGLKRAKRYYEDSRNAPAFGGELPHFRRALDGEALARASVDEIQSSGYVIHTLEAALWCLLHTDTYAACVLEAVSLGEDTDTTAAVAGGLAGLYYGPRDIPASWLNQLARRAYIIELCAAFAASLTS